MHLSCREARLESFSNFTRERERETAEKLNGHAFVVVVIDFNGILVIGLKQLLVFFHWGWCFDI